MAKEKGRRMNFRSRAAYDRWLAYDKMHVDRDPSPHPVDVEIRGKEATPQHFRVHDHAHPRASHHVGDCDPECRKGRRLHTHRRKR